MKKNTNFLIFLLILLATFLMLGIVLTPFVAADEPPSGPICETITFHESGLWWVELWTDQPSTGPGLVVVETGLATQPRFVRRAEGVLLRVERPGRYLVCLTSQAPAGEHKIRTLRISGLDPKEDGDPDETEVILDPFRTPPSSCPSI